MSQIGIEHKYEQIKKNVRTMELKKIKIKKGDKEAKPHGR